jgi:class 3 adenylate cyclase/tetratricopeptide (TPR) repeat protein
MSTPGPFDAVIAALEAQRPQLGDAAVDAAIAVLRGHAAAPASPEAAASSPALSPAFSPTSSPASSLPPATRRVRQVSVLFVDIVESTRLLRTVGVHESAAVVDAAVQRFAAIVREQGGEVLRYTGDGLKAAFGVHGTREDEAERAVRAGLQLLEAGREHGERLAATHAVENFGVRVGIHTGPVMLGGGAEADRTALGEVVHVAARMEQSAPVGRLRISADTHAQVRGLFRVAAQPPLAVKGLDQPLHTWLVEAESGDVERASQRGVEGVSTPLIGRDAEFEALLAQHALAVQHGELRAVTIVADAGVGKTRLRRELLARLGLAREGVGLLQARAHPAGTLQAYGLLRQMVARWLRITDDQPIDSARAAFVDGIAPWLGPRAGVSAVVRAQALAHLLGLKLDDEPAVAALGPRELRETAFGALTEALHTLARRAPLVVVLDDLHWADAASLDFVERLAQPTPVPLLLLLLARPALRERRPAPLAAAAPGITLELAPLDAQAGPALANALLAPLADPSHEPTHQLPNEPRQELRQLLVQRAAGNPFYMEELLRMLIDDGTVDTRQRPWRLKPGWQQTVRVPTTLVGVLQARLDALPADELRALQEASIVGPVFWDHALEAIDTGAARALPALHGRRLVVARGESAFAQAEEHAFQHQLLHEVTYDTVLAEARRAGHLRVAEWLAERVGDRASEFLGITAEHFERGGDSARALDYYDRAWFDAELRYAYESALVYQERALRQPALRDDPVFHCRLLQFRATTLEAMGRADEATATAQMAERAALELGDAAVLADQASVQMLRADREGRVDDARALAHRAIELAEASGRAPSAGALGHGELAWLAVVAHDFAAVEAHLERGIAFAREAAKLPRREGGHGHYEVQLRTIGIESLLKQDRLFDVIEAVAETIRTTPATRVRDNVQLRFRLVTALVGCGDLEAAGRASDEACEMAERISTPRLLSDALMNRASVAWLSGRPEEALAVAEAALAQARACAHAFGVTGALAVAARAHTALGRLDVARKTWTAVVAQRAEQQADLQRCEALLALAGVALRQGDRAAAATALDEAVAAVTPEPAGAEEGTEAGTEVTAAAVPAAPVVPAVPATAGEDAAWGQLSNGSMAEALEVAQALGRTALAAVLRTRLRAALDALLTQAAAHPGDEAQRALRMRRVAACECFAAVRVSGEV